MKISKTEFWGIYTIAFTYAAGLAIGVYSEFVAPGGAWIALGTSGVILIILAIGRGIYVAGRKSKAPEEDAQTVEDIIQPLNHSEYDTDGEVVARSTSYEVQYWNGEEWRTLRKLSDKDNAEREMNSYANAVPSYGPYQVVRTL